MLNTSRQYRETILKKRSFCCKGSISLANGEVLEITNEDIMESGFSIEQGVSRENEFEIGAAVISQLSLQLKNNRDQFSRYDFYGAEINIWIGLQLLDGTIEYLKKGIYTVDAPTAPGMTIHITALDHMVQFDCEYSKVSTVYPATLLRIVQDICSYCGVPLASSRFDNDDFTVRQRPDDEALSCREMLSYVAQIAGCFVRCNVNGALELDWYKTAAFDRMDDLYGGRFDKISPEVYQTGDAVDGGFFDDWSPDTYLSGDSFCGGDFSAMDSYHYIYSLSSLDVSTDNVVITGIQVAEDGGAVSLFGEEGYVLAVERNPLIVAGQGQQVAEHLGGKIVGMRFRPLSCNCLGDPSIEAGDCAYVSDRKGNAYPCYITNISYTIGDYMRFSCDAKTPSANNAKSYSPAVKAVISARKEVKQQISNYDLAVQQLTNLMSQSFGVFKTMETLEDGSVVYYMHNKPELEESNTIWKMTSDALAVSTDGGKTWNAGIDSEGNSVVNVLSAIGIQADWIKATDLQAIGATIGGWRINNSQIYKVVDLYPDMTAEGLSDLEDQDPVQYWVWMRSPVNQSTPVFGIYYMRKGDYLDGIRSVYPIFSARADGTITANSFVSSNANITGGKINIRSNSKEISVIELKGKHWDSNSNEDMWVSINPYGVGCNRGIREGENTETHYSSLSISSDYIAFSKQGVDGWAFYVGGDFEEMWVGLDAFFYKRLVCLGAKSRVINTNDFGKVLQYCYETPSPIFGDIGCGKTDEEGLCYIYFDPVFQETVSANMTYHVFLQKEGRGELWVHEKTEEYFIVLGTPNLKFSWEVKVRQRDYEYERMETYESNKDKSEIDYENEAMSYLNNYEKEILNHEETD